MASLHELSDRYSVDIDGEGVYGTSWEDLTPLIEEQLRSFDFDSPEKFDETNSTPLHLLVSEQPPLHVVNMMLAADRGQASLPNDDGCFPLELAVSYGASLDVIMAIAEAFPPALEKNSMKLNPPTCLYSSSPTSTLTTSFYSPIPFCEVVNVVKKRDFASLGSNLRRYLSIEKRMEAMVLIRCMIRKEDSQQPQTEGQIEEIYRNPLLRGVGFNHNNELRFAYSVIRYGLEGNFIISNTIFCFLSAAG